MKYKDLNAYVKANGYKVSELSEDELRQAKEELDFINSGGVILDGVFSEMGYKKESN